MPRAAVRRDRKHAPLAVGQLVSASHTEHRGMNSGDALGRHASADVHDIACAHRGYAVGSPHDQPASGVDVGRDPGE